jgi:hypothetical protein
MATEIRPACTSRTGTYGCAREADHAGEHSTIAQNGARWLRLRWVTTNGATITTDATAAVRRMLSAGAR